MRLSPPIALVTLTCLAVVSATEASDYIGVAGAADSSSQSSSNPVSNFLKQFAQPQSEKRQSLPTDDKEVVEPSRGTALRNQPTTTTKPITREEAEQASDYVSAHASERSRGECGKAVRTGFDDVREESLPRKGSASQYGEVYEGAGMELIAHNACIEPKKGDVAIVQPVEGHEHGHAAISDGEDWASDYKQRNKSDGLGGIIPSSYFRDRPVQDIDIDYYRAPETPEVGENISGYSGIGDQLGASEERLDDQNFSGDSYAQGDQDRKVPAYTGNQPISSSSSSSSTSSSVDVGTVLNVANTLIGAYAAYKGNSLPTMPSVASPSTYSSRQPSVPSSSPPSPSYPNSSSGNCYRAHDGSIHCTTK